jgi:hypothetical protein
MVPQVFSAVARSTPQRASASARRSQRSAATRSACNQGSCDSLRSVRNSAGGVKIERVQRAACKDAMVMRHGRMRSCQHRPGCLRALVSPRALCGTASMQVACVGKQQMLGHCKGGCARPWMSGMSGSLSALLSRISPELDTTV